MFNVTFQLGTEEYKTKGKTIIEAFDKLPIVQNVKALKGVLIVSDGKKEITKILNGKITRNLARNSITRGIWAKILATGF